MSGNFGGMDLKMAFLWELDALTGADTPIESLLYWTTRNTES